MKVLEHSPQQWFLFEHKGKLLLDARCSHSFIDYSLMIELNEQELALYQCGGSEYLSKLAYEIHYSAPIVAGSTSAYRGRDLSKYYSELSDAAVKKWREST